MMEVRDQCLSFDISADLPTTFFADSQMIVYRKQLRSRQHSLTIFFCALR
jgi:hypothetical protein